jgi:hypothetical protein
MTTILPERATVVDGIPTMPVTAAPVILPELLAGIGLVVHRVPRWITDPALIQSIVDGFIDIPDELNPQEGP